MRGTAIVGGGAALLLATFAAAEEPFDSVAAHFEQNITDGDAEVVLKATSGDAGLSSLKIEGPDGRTVVDMKVPDSKLGLRSFEFESPEPNDDGRLRADYPEGAYAFTGKTVSGAELAGTATLSHASPEPVEVVYPPEVASDVPLTGVIVTWRVNGSPESFVVDIEQEETGVKASFHLLGGVREVKVPDGFLLPDTEYKLAIGTVSPNGNRSFVEREFSTRSK